MKKVIFNGITISDNALENPLFLSHIEGLEAGSVKRNEIEYIDTDGVKFADIFFEPRIVTIEGYIVAQSRHTLLNARRQLLHAFNPKKQAEFYYKRGTETYYALAYADSLPEFGARFGWCLPFTAYININSFYLLSGSEIKTTIFQKTNNLKTTFTLPCVFSYRTSTSTIFNDGDVELYGTVQLICSTDSDSTNIEIKNVTENTVFSIEGYAAEAEEVIVVDFENGTAVSNKKGNIMPYVSAESEFFPIVPGNNDISCTSEDIDLIASIAYRKRYIGV